jgi:Na+/proline symporter
LTVPEIIGSRFGDTAMILSVVALLTAYLVIVSYQFNAGGAVIYTIFHDNLGSGLTLDTGYGYTNTILKGMIINMRTELSIESMLE